MSARETLALAFHAQQVEYRPYFGVTTAAHRRGTLFVWRNYLTGDWGTITRAAEYELVEVTLAILDELRALRTPRKMPEKARSVVRRRKVA